MPARVHSFVLRGIDAEPCEIEVDLAHGAGPPVTVVGLPDAAVRESAERVRAAIANLGHVWPTERVIISLAPADRRKEGPVYDLPVAVALLAADGVVHASSSSGQWSASESGSESASGSASGFTGARAPARASAPCGSRSPNDDRLLSYLMAGELALDGRVRPVRGVVGLAMLARRRGARGVIVPAENAAEAAVVEGIEVRRAARLEEVVAFLNGLDELPLERAVDVDRLLADGRATVDFSEVRGQGRAKRALTVAAAGGHNVLLVGPAGTGKTMMARALPGILPRLTRREALDVTAVHSGSGCLAPGSALVATRPVRAPHHTASTASIVGGGTVPRPGEVSLAHLGVLFLDELPEFARPVLEALREPLEDGHVTIARASGSVRFPAEVMLVAAMNPTRRGGGRVVRGGGGDGYLDRLSGPLVDRIDLHVEVLAVPIRDLLSAADGGSAGARTDAATALSTAVMAQRVRAARERMRRRDQECPNARLTGRELDRLVPLGRSSRRVLEEAMTELGLSARAFDTIRRVALTIADLDDRPEVEPGHVEEAVHYRLLDRHSAA